MRQSHSSTEPMWHATCHSKNSSSLIIIIELLNRTEMVPRGPSFGIGSAHAQNALANRKNARPSRDRACIARCPANSRYSPARLALRSAPSSELALRLFQRHENSAKSRCTTRYRMRCIAFAVASTLAATKPGACRLENSH